MSEVPISQPSVPSDAPTPSVSKSSSRIEVVAVAQERVWKEWRSRLSDIDQLIATESTANTGDEKAEKLKRTLDSFIRDAHDVVEQLSFLGALHPGAQAAISGFQKIIEFDIARRDNDKKILAMALEMQGMMSPIFQLRFLNHENIPKEARDDSTKRFDDVMAEIAKDINKCRSDINDYKQRKFMMKLCLARRFEKRFEGHMKTFSSQRAKLQTAVSGYIAIGMSSATTSLVRLEEKVDELRDIQLDIRANIFRSLDTPTERRVFKYMDENGGPETCVNTPHLFTKLMEEAGQPSVDKYDLLQQLIKALKENLDEVLEDKFQQFQKIIRAENNNFRDDLQRISAHLDLQDSLTHHSASKLEKVLDNTVVMMLQLGKVKSVADKLEDPEFHRVWTKMQVAGNTVKAKRFVLTLRDHIPAEEFTMTLSETAFDTEATESDSWVLKYIDVPYIRPIIEAMDEDSSGFISVKEANSFSLARPKGLSLLHWIAYWAAGWHLNLDRFRVQIYSILVEMHAALPKIHIANRAYVSEYLDNDSLRRVEALLLSIKPLPQFTPRETQLMEIADDVAKAHCRSLETNLGDAKYIIESVEHVMAIAGSESARVETWILPLLLLLLKHQLKIIHLAKTVILNRFEMIDHIWSLDFVMAAFDKRMRNLEAIFLPLYGDIQAQFQTFSYGMFDAAFRKADLNKTEHILISLLTEDQGSANTVFANDEGLPMSDPKSILSRDVGPAFEYEDLGFEFELSYSKSEPMEQIPHPLEGLWYGKSFGDKGAPNHFFCCVIHPILGKAFQGKGAEFFYGSFDITGELDTATAPSEGNIDVKMELLQRREPCIYTGTYDPHRRAIVGKFVLTSGKSTKSEAEDVVPESNLENVHSVDSEVRATTENSNEDEKSGSFELTRNPPKVLLFREKFLVDASYRSPWNFSEIARKRWTFAIESVLLLNSMKSVRKILALRRKWLVLAVRVMLEVSEPNRYRPMSDEEWTEFEAIQASFHPAIGMLYSAIADYMFSRRMYDVGNAKCDSCGKSIIFIRQQCIVCVADNSFGQIDLCANCCDSEISDIPELYNRTGFTHMSSHALLRSRYRVNAFEVKAIIEYASKKSEEIKNIFGSLERKKKQSPRKRRNIDARKSVSEDPDPVDPQCFYCGVQVSTPCWVCIDCVPLRYTCDTHDRMSDHSRVHLSLRIQNSDEVKAVITNDIERQLEGLKSTVESLHTKLEKVEEILGGDELDDASDILGGDELDDALEDQGSDEFDDPLASSSDIVQDEGASGGVKDGPKDDVGNEGEDEAKGKDETVIDGSPPTVEPTQVKGEPKVEESPIRQERVVGSQLGLSARLSKLEQKFESMNNTLNDRYTSLERKIDEVLRALTPNRLPPQSPDESSNGPQ